MTKVLILGLTEKTYTVNPLVMSWAAYQAFCLVTPGEGTTWKAVLI